MAINASAKESTVRLNQPGDLTGHGRIKAETSHPRIKIQVIRGTVRQPVKMLPGTDRGRQIVGPVLRSHGFPGDFENQDGLGYAVFPKLYPLLYRIDGK